MWYRGGKPLAQTGLVGPVSTAQYGRLALQNRSHRSDTSSDLGSVPSAIALRVKAAGLNAQILPVASSSLHIDKPGSDSVRDPSADSLYRANG